jgi:hypothetical protein
VGDGEFVRGGVVAFGVGLLGWQRAEIDRDFVVVRGALQGRVGQSEDRGEDDGGVQRERDDRAAWHAEIGVFLAPHG